MQDDADEHRQSAARAARAHEAPHGGDAGADRADAAPDAPRSPTGEAQKAASPSCDTKIAPPDTGDETQPPACPAASGHTGDAVAFSGAIAPSPDAAPDDPMPDPAAVAAARAYFPRGMAQPADGFRFSIDALLLADFSPLRGVRRVVDLGCGCGVVGLALMLREPDAGFACTGIDLNPDMIAFARANAARLGFARRYDTAQADVAAVRAHPALLPESADLVVCNPPYREPGRGRRCPDPGRDTARFESSASVSDFIRAAAYLLQNRKRACFIGLPERLDALLADCAATRLTPKRLRFVHSRPGDPACLVLLEAMKNGGQGMTVSPPLVLYAGDGSDAAPTFPA